MTVNTATTSTRPVSRYVDVGASNTNAMTNAKITVAAPDVTQSEFELMTGTYHQTGMQPTNRAGRRTGGPPVTRERK